MTNKTVAIVSFWLLVAAIGVNYFLAVMVLVRPTTVPAAIAMLAAIYTVLGLITWFSLLVLLYSLASMLGVFGEKAK